MIVINVTITNPCGENFTDGYIDIVFGLKKKSSALDVYTNTLANAMYTSNVFNKLLRA